MAVAIHGLAEELTTQFSQLSDRKLEIEEKLKLASEKNHLSLRRELVATERRMQKVQRQLISVMNHC